MNKIKIIQSHDPIQLMPITYKMLSVIAKKENMNISELLSEIFVKKPLNVDTSSAIMAFILAYTSAEL